MGPRLSSFLPRFVALTLIALLATTTLTFAAEQRIVAAPPVAVKVDAGPTVVVVPNVRDQAYVFAKGTLEESGFAWRVAGPVKGYAANLVVSQRPAAGTRLVDTGAPTITVTLARNPKYPEEGAPEAASPFPGTAVRLADAAAAPAKQPARPKKKAPVRKPPAKREAPKKKARPQAPSKPKAAPTKRPRAFVAPGAPAEPLGEMPLPNRARLLRAWVESHRTPSYPNVQHWFYQHSWVVTGARFGWWRGAEALRTLIAVDERVQQLWGMGARSEAVARATLAEVAAKSR